MRSATIPGLPGRPALQGIWAAEAPRVAVVAPPHPLMGGSLTNSVVQALAAGFRDAGLGVLLFNNRGVGESDGDMSPDPADANDDYAAALAFATATTTVVVASGYSFGGAAAACTAARHGALPVLAVAPPPALLPDGALLALAGRLTLVAGERDTIAVAKELDLLALSVSGARVVTLQGADHFFGGALSEIRRIAGRVAEAL